MEDQYDRPMLFEPDLIPDPAVAGENIGAWGQGVAVYGAACKVTSVPVLHPHCWLACWGSSVRRKWLTQSSTFSHTEVTS